MSAAALSQCLIALACALTLWRMTRELPLQNVLACAGIIAALASLIEITNAKVGLPFGTIIFTENLGYRLFHILPWPVPLLWIIILLNSRRLARLILHHQRPKPNYGLQVIALTAFLTTLFDILLEHLATKKHWWLWTNPPTNLSWFGTSWTNSVGWFASSLFIGICIMPFLLDKKSAGQLQR